MQNNPFKEKLCRFVLLAAMTAGICNPAVTAEITGDVRVDILSGDVVRLEVKGPGGFEDRPTYHIQSRKLGENIKYSKSTKEGLLILTTKDFSVSLPAGAKDLTGAVIKAKDGSTLWEYPESEEGVAALMSNRRWLPEPAEKPVSWAIADSPRYVPASADTSWGGGYNVAPEGLENNGWDLKNDSTDIYVFLPQGCVDRLREDFIELTGRTELIPLYALGGWDSRYYPYEQQEALDKIDLYRQNDIPLDVFVVDTDWRVGASHGYGVNEKLFPNMEQFIEDAHNKGVRIMFNDHPEPQAPMALDRGEVTYRNENLRGLFDIGLDIWWYDRNWHTALRPPAGINKESFGSYIYDWITRDYYPERRAIIMSNVDGIDNGWIRRAPNITNHRFTLQWTGDTYSDFDSLSREIRNAVYSGVRAAYPYTSTDVGGHMGHLTTEQYCRWIEFATFSPIFRLHCGRSYTRDPWSHPEPCTQVVSDYMKMRMSLLPVYYAAARENYETGVPMLRRCDMLYPEYEEAKDDYQYILGDNVLIAPVHEAAEPVFVVPQSWLKDGVKGEYFAGIELAGEPKLTRTDKAVNFDWQTGTCDESLDKDSFSVRWSGKLTLPAGPEPYQLGIASDDGCRLYVDGELILDKWIDKGVSAEYSDKILAAGKAYDIRAEYYERGGDAVCKLIGRKKIDKVVAKRNIWIPEGTWTDLWTGTAITGPKNITLDVDMVTLPLFVRSGAILPLAPVMQHTGEKDWSEMTLDVYPAENAASQTTLYEDDGDGIGYRNGEFRKTLIESETKGKDVTLIINSAVGDFPGSVDKRSWTIRMRKPLGVEGDVKKVTVNGKKTDFELVEAREGALPFIAEGGAADGDFVKIEVPASKVAGKSLFIFPQKTTVKVSFK
jgi:alpha-glucosidase (family GH31 glycosyl hydrolase)